MCVLQVTMATSAQVILIRDVSTYLVCYQATLTGGKFPLACVLTFIYIILCGSFKLHLGVTCNIIIYYITLRGLFILHPGV